MRHFNMILSLVIGGTAYADIISWRASDSLLPDDPIIDATQRFVIDGQSLFLSLGSTSLNVMDDSDQLNVGITKADIPSIASDGVWAFESVIRVNSHNRPNFDYGPSLGIDNEVARFRLAVTIDRAGFLTNDGFGFIDGVFALVDADSAFHHYRVKSDGSMVTLFVDDLVTPVLSIPTSSFDPATESKIWLLDTSNPGQADFDVRSFAANPLGSDIPSPVTCKAADCDSSGDINFADLLCALFQFGEPGPNSNADCDQSGMVDFSDLICILFQFGPCS